MPAISAGDLALMRSGPPVIEYYMAIMPRLVVFAASLDDADATYGLGTLDYDGVTVGAWGDIRAGQTLECYDSTGTVYRGKVRVRGASATTITIAANNDIEWTDDDLLYVINWFEPWGVQTGMADVGGSTVYYKDSDIAWTSEAASFPPKANGGVAWAGFSSGGTADVDFTAALSYAMAPGASIASYSWDIEDGSFQVGSAATAAITARFPIGFRYIHITVTDDNAQTGIHHIPVWVFGGNYQPLKYGLQAGGFEMKRRQAEVRDSELVFEVFEDSIDTSEVPEGTCVCLFSITRVLGAEVTEDLGAEFSGRQPIKSLAWVLDDGIDYNPDTGTVEFSCGTIGKVADQLPGWGTFVKDATPEDWHACTDDLTVRRALYFMLNWQSTLCQVAHIEFLGYGADTTPDIAGRKFTVAPPLKQLEAAILMQRGIFARIGCTRWGSIHIRYDPQELGTTGRDARDQIMYLPKTDLYQQMQFNKSTRPRAQSVLGGGIAYDGTDGTPFRGRSPGQAPRRAGKALRMDNLIITDQDDLNDLLGRYLAVESNEWDDVPLITMWDVFEPALQEYVKFEVDADQNPRGFTFTDATKWVVRRVEAEDQPKGANIINATVELLVDGFGGVTVEIPEAPTLPKPPFPGPRPGPGPEPTYPAGKVVFAATDYGPFYALDIDDTNPWWDDIGASATLNGTDCIEIVQNPLVPLALACFIRTPNYDTNQDFGDIWVIDNYLTGTWTKLIDGNTAWIEMDAIDTIDNPGGFEQIMYTSEGYLLARLRYEDGFNKGFCRVWSWADPHNSTVHTVGAQVNANDIVPVCFVPGGWCRFAGGDPWITNTLHERAPGGSVMLVTTIQVNVFTRSIAAYSSDYFATFNNYTNGNDDNNVNSWLARYGGVMLPSGDLITHWFDETWADVLLPYKQMIWTGGTFPVAPGSFLNEWNAAGTQVWNQWAQRRMWALGDGDTGYFWAAADSYDPTLPPYTYGDTEIYLLADDSTPFNTMELPINGRSFDSFWGAQAVGGTLPSDRIVIGNRVGYNPGAMSGVPHMVYLLTAGGTTVANKSGGLGPYGLQAQDVTLIYDVKFDQYSE